MNSTCIETNCIIEHEGRKFESGGAFIGIDKNGKHGGIVYAYEKESKIGNWHGNIKLNARFCREYRSNMGDKRQSVYFKWNGISFYGIYFKQNSEIIRCKEIK